MVPCCSSHMYCVIVFTGEILLLMSHRGLELLKLCIGTFLFTYYFFFYSLKDFFYHEIPVFGLCAPSDVRYTWVFIKATRLRITTKPRTMVLMVGRERRRTMCALNTSCNNEGQISHCLRTFSTCVGGNSSPDQEGAVVFRWRHARGQDDIINWFHQLLVIVCCRLLRKHRVRFCLTIS